MMLYFDRESKDVSNGTNFASYLGNFLDVLTSIGYHECPPLLHVFFFFSFFLSTVTPVICDPSPRCVMVVMIC